MGLVPGESGDSIGLGRPGALGFRFAFRARLGIEPQACVPRRLGSECGGGECIPATTS